MRRPLNPGGAAASLNSGALRLSGPLAHWRERRWDTAIAVSALVLIVVALALAVGWFATHTTRTTTSTINATVTRIELQLPSGSVDIVGGTGSAVQVRRIDKFAFGHAAHERRSLSGGVLRLSSSCPRIIVGSCSSSYRITVPEGVAISVSTTGGDVHFADFRGSAAIQTGSGNVAVDTFCGFGLSATSRSGDLRVTAACAPEKLNLRSDSGNAIALVPPGRYRIQASSSSGRRHIAGVVPTAQATFSIGVQSRSGDVAVEGGI